MSVIQGNTPQPAGINTVAMTADIVSAYVTKNSLPLGDLPKLLRSVHDALGRLTEPQPAEPEKRVPPIPIKKTVTPDYIISLEDGKSYKTLKRHLAGRGLSPEQYRQKWSLPATYPMVAANYAAQRSELAKSSGLGRKAAAPERAAPDVKVSGPKEGQGRRRKAAR